MAQYLRRPALVQARQVTGDDPEVVDTPRGPVPVQPGDWVVEQGDYTYFVRDEQFQRQYKATLSFDGLHDNRIDPSDTLPGVHL